jgi:hypothetical protein
MILLCLGMSNALTECEVFRSLVAANYEASGGEVHDQVRVVNGAQGGATSSSWSNPAHPVWNVAESRLADAGATPAQVVAVWGKTTLSGNTADTLADGESAQTFEIEAELADMARNVSSRFPNAVLLFWSSRIYAGYASTTLSPEPYAYEHGYAVKFLIEAQIQQLAGAGTDPIAGDLGLDVAPWMGWGPYLWADGLIPRSDGLTWECSDYLNDGTHPDPRTGGEKVAAMLLDFMLTSSFSGTWFSATYPLGPRPRPDPPQHRDARSGSR